MAARLHALMLLAIRSDARASLLHGEWQTPCLHCRCKVGVSAEGRPWPGTTLEHIVPRSWFGRRQATALTLQVGSADDARNLALACARCNHAKGRGPDARGPADARAHEIVANLLKARQARWREPESNEG